MALGVSVDDDRRAFCRRCWYDYTGQPPSVNELNLLVVTLAEKGADALLAGVYDGPQAQAFRTRRGW